MDLLKEVVYEHLERSTRTNYIDRFTDILAPIPQGAKADYYRIEKIKEVCIDAKKKMDYKQSEYDCGKISFDEMTDEKKAIQNDVINNLKDRKVTILEINKLIRDVYDEHPELNKHGRVIKLKNSKTKITDARDQNLVKHEAGGWMLQWLYSAHKDEFLKARVCKINCVKQHRLFDTPLFLYGKKFSTRLCIIGRNWQTIFLEVNNYVTGF